jgi:hypothetical protein
MKTPQIKPAAKWSIQHSIDREAWLIVSGTLVVPLLTHCDFGDYDAPITRTFIIHRTSDGASMVAPSGEGAVRCMRQAIATVEAPIDYINTHGISTPAGDIAELEAMREVFKDSELLIQEPRTLGVSGFSTKQRENKVIPKSDSWSS